MANNATENQAKLTAVDNLRRNGYIAGPDTVVLCCPPFLPLFVFSERTYSKLLTTIYRREKLLIAYRNCMYLLVLCVILFSWCESVLNCF